MLPDGWRIYSLDDLGEFKNGLNKTKDDFGHGNEFINLNDVFGKSIVNTKNLGLVKCTKDDIRNYCLEKGDVLFVRSSVKPIGVGLTALFDSNLNNIVYSGFLIRFRQKNNLISHNYLKYCFLEENFRNRLLAKSTISANTNINQENLKKLKITIPPFPEQQKIAKILSTWDEAIEKMEKKLHFLRVEQLFFLNHFLSQSDSKNSVLGDYFNVKNGFAFKSSEFKDLGVSLIRISNISEGSVNKDGVFLPKEYLKKYEAFQVLKGDVLIAMSGATTGKFGIYQHDEPSLLNQRVGKFQAIDPKIVDQRIVRYVLYNLQARIYDIAAGGAQPNISSSGIESISLSLPSVDKQKKICDLLDSVEDTIFLCSKQLALFSEQKQALMQQLLTGKKRVIL